MSNRPKDETRWDQILQVSVTEEVKTSIAKISEKTGKSQSSVIRELIDQSLKSNTTFESHGEKSQWLNQTESKLNDFKSLLGKELISQEEYEAMRKNLLGLC